jgi:biopolymer transport protein TolR
MRPIETPQVQSAINVTPLVDVVLVLLIIFMVIAPQLHSGPELQLPVTERPPDKPDDGQQILVALEHDGTLWLDNDRVTAVEFPELLRQTTEQRADWQVVIKGDARLTFGEVQRAMLAVEAAGFPDVGLIAERQQPSVSEVLR